MLIECIKFGTGEGRIQKAPVWRDVLSSFLSTHSWLSTSGYLILISCIGGVGAPAPSLSGIQVTQSSNGWCCPLILFCVSRPCTRFPLQRTSLAFSIQVLIVPDAGHISIIWKARSMVSLKRLHDLPPPGTVASMSLASNSRFGSRLSGVGNKVHHCCFIEFFISGTSSVIAAFCSTFESMARAQ